MCRKVIRGGNRCWHGNWKHIFLEKDFQLRSDYKNTVLGPFALSSVWMPSVTKISRTPWWLWLQLLLGQPKPPPEPSSWSSCKTQTCWLSQDQPFTSCKYRKLSWGLWVSHKNSTSLHQHYQFRIWRNFGTWVVPVKWYTKPSEVFVFPFGIFLPSAAEMCPVANDSLFSKKQWGH